MHQLAANNSCIKVIPHLLCRGIGRYAKIGPTIKGHIRMHQPLRCRFENDNSHLSPCRSMTQSQRREKISRNRNAGPQ